MLDGYYQDHRLFTGESSAKFIDRLDWSGYDDMRGYDDVDSSIFIHVRGGDYLQPGVRDVHYVDLRQYYKNAIAKCSGVAHAYVFTNDKPYLESLDCFDDIRHTVVQSKTELNDLYVMSQCGRGGIAANSTFSWWGLYLDRQRKNLMLPSKWFNDDKPSDGLFFPEAQRISVV